MSSYGISRFKTVDRYQVTDNSVKEMMQIGGTSLTAITKNRHYCLNVNLVPLMMLMSLQRELLLIFR